MDVELLTRFQCKTCRWENRKLDGNLASVCCLVYEEHTGLC